MCKFTDRITQEDEQRKFMWVDMVFRPPVVCKVAGLVGERSLRRSATHDTGSAIGRVIAANGVIGTAGCAHQRSRCISVYVEFDHDQWATGCESYVSPYSGCIHRA